MLGGGVVVVALVSADALVGSEMWSQRRFSWRMAELCWRRWRLHANCSLAAVVALVGALAVSTGVGVGVVSQGAPSLSVSLRETGTGGGGVAMEALGGGRRVRRRKSK